MKKIKKYILYSLIILMVLIVSTYIFIYKELDEIHNIINPTRNTIFNYNMDTVNITVGKVRYKVPKAYFYSKKFLGGGEFKELSIRASIKDDMMPWTLSQSFKDKDKNSIVRIHIRAGIVEPYRSKFPYINIENSKKYGGKKYGEYQKIFTRYDGEIIKKKSSTGLVEKSYLSRFFLIPNNTKEKYSISCPAHDPDIVNCTVTRLYKKNITYRFLIPHRFIEKYEKYDQEVAKLVENLIIEY